MIVWDWFIHYPHKLRHKQRINPKEQSFSLQPADNRDLDNPNIKRPKLDHYIGFMSWMTITV